MVSNNTITTPINVTDPYTLLGVSSSGGAWDIGYICSNTHGKINKWSKYKPVRYNSLGDLTDAQRASVNYGLAVPAIQTQPSATKTDVWGYNAPRGGEYNEVYRIDDFNGYNHLCISPLSECDDVDFNIVFNNEITIGLNKNPSPAGVYAITLADVTAIKDYYLCLLLTLSDGSTKWKTSEITLGSGANDVKLLKTELPQLGSGYVYGYYLCASSVKRSSMNAAIQSATYLSLPCDDVTGLAKTLTIKRDLPVMFTLTGVGSVQSGQLPVQFNPVTNYIGPLPGGGVSNKNNYYFMCGTYYTLQLRFTLKNTGDAITLDKNKLGYSLSRNFATSNEVGSFHFSHMYERDGTEYVEKDSLTFALGEEKTVVLEIGDNRLKYDGTSTVTNPTSGQAIQVNIYYDYNNYTKLRSQDIRLRNSTVS